MSHGAAPSGERLVLVGFMAAGKSTVGRRLAARLGWDFVDFDEEILARTGRSSAEWIRSEGEASLRRLEAALTDEMARRGRVVLAPGGGWATVPGLPERLGSGTLRVWLQVEPEVAIGRARSGDLDRPLLGDEPDPAAAAALLRAREPAYAAADLAVDTTSLDADGVVDVIVRWLGTKNGGR